MKSPDENDLVYIAERKVVASELRDPSSASAVMSINSSRGILNSVSSSISFAAFPEKAIVLSIISAEIFLNVKLPVAIRGCLGPDLLAKNEPVFAVFRERW